MWISIITATFTHKGIELNKNKFNIEYIFNEMFHSQIYGLENVCNKTQASCPSSSSFSYMNLRIVEPLLQNYRYYLNIKLEEIGF